VDALKNETTYGLEKSVSDYAWYRALEKLGKNPADYNFQNRDPEQAAQAIQIGSSKASQLWNPFTLQTLRTKKDSKILFDSTSIPGEIVDMVVIDNATLTKPGGANAARCIIETYYAVCNNLKSSNKKVSDATYIALGDQFSSLGLDDMKACADMASQPDASKKVTTRFYDTPELGKKVFESGNMEPIMDHIVRWCKVRQILDDSPGVSYPDKPNAGLLKFDSQYMDVTTISR
jgi:NitT/TauT family transport system substrate-binding protein